MILQRSGALSWCSTTRRIETRQRLVILILYLYFLFRDFAEAKNTFKPSLPHAFYFEHSHPPPSHAILLGATAISPFPFLVCVVCTSALFECAALEPIKHRTERGNFKRLRKHPPRRESTSKSSNFRRLTTDGSLAMGIQH